MRTDLQKSPNYAIPVIMKKNIALFIYLLIFFPSLAQYNIRFIVSDSAQKNEIFLAGNFNQWNPGDMQFKLNSVDALHKSIVLKNFSPGPYEFKFTRGNWATVESLSMGLDIDNRKVQIRGDTTIYITIMGWIDDYSDISKLPDTLRLNVLWTRSSYYLERNLDSSFNYAKDTYQLSKKIGFRWGEAFSLNLLGQILQRQGNADKALELFFKALPTFLESSDSFYTASVYNNIGNIFDYEQDYSKAKSYYFKAISFAPWNNEGENSQKSSALMSIGRVYYNTNKLDSADYYARQSYNIDIKEGLSLGSILILMGDIHQKTGRYEQALANYRQAVTAGYIFNKLTFVITAYERIAQRLYESNQTDSGFYYARRAYLIAKHANNPFSIVSAADLLVDLFKKENRLDSGFIYQEIAIHTKDSLYTQEKMRQIQNFSFIEQLRQQGITAERQQLKNSLRIYALAAALLFFLFIAAALWRNNWQKQKANLLLHQQNKKIESTLTELKSTQSLLIQSEKMASLGQLTAGIAHEIQNPLNFVNNFSEVSNELIEEMVEEADKGNTNEVKAIAEDLKQNLEKILHHGKRADAIVKGMLQHSRSSSGVKEPTDINKLAGEYLRLAYHGLRAKDKSFNATMKTDFDESIGKINIIPQDIGRVILNLITNAFYAAPLPPPAGGGFKISQYKHEPTVWIKTFKNYPAGGRGAEVLISVRDNGPGIPQKILDKIFQPFFTTKPTGQGTGLGLSLSYDIIKAHGGELKVETKEGEFAEFTITLPV